MAVDITWLAGALSNYQQVLEQNLSRIRAAHTELTQSYGALKEEYDGEGAREFAASWESAGSAMLAYVDGVPALIRLLEEKIEQLGRIDRGF